MSEPGLGHLLDPETLRLERKLPGPIERVWSFLTEPDQRRRWLGGGDFELRVGGAITLLFDHRSLSPEKETPEQHREVEGARVTGQVIACEPPRLLTITWRSWGPEAQLEEAAEVSFALTPQGQDVKLEVTHRRLRRRVTVGRAAAGWHTHLGILEDLLHERSPRGFWSTYEARARDYDERLRQMDDYFSWSAGVGREIRDGGKSWSSLIRRRMDAPLDRVWAAWTDPAKISLWFGKPAGELRVGGTVLLDLFQPQKTTVKILTCEPPRLLRTTWQYGDTPPTEVELRLRADGSATHLELEHYGAPGPADARGTGSGWEVALLHLDHWLRAFPRPTGVMHPAMDTVWTRLEGTPART